MTVIEVETRTLVRGIHAPIVAENMTEAEIPAGWLVFNAPRPLYGDRTWIGPFSKGVFYAAIDPTEDAAAANVEANRDLDAALIRWVTEAEIREWADAYYRREWPKQYERIAPKIKTIPVLDLLDVYRDNTPKVETISVKE